MTDVCFGLCKGFRKGTHFAAVKKFKQTSHYICESHQLVSKNVFTDEVEMQALSFLSGHGEYMPTNEGGR